MSLNYYCEEKNDTNKEESVNKYKFLLSNYEKNPS